MKKHFIELTNENNKKLQNIKKEKGLRNVNQTINYIIGNYKLKNDN